MNTSTHTLPSLSPMLPALSSTIPRGEEWRYELKFDGYRALVYWTVDSIHIVSRNGKLYNELFPEVVDACLRFTPQLKDQLPLIVDGELCILASPARADFSLIQQRGRFRSLPKIASAAKKHPATLICFDLLHYQDQDLRFRPYLERKEHLKQVLGPLLPSQPGARDASLRLIEVYEQPDHLWELVLAEDAEGIVAKLGCSVWQSGKRTTDWIKVKNYKLATCFITAYDKQNAYFHVGVLRDKEVQPVGLFSHGLSDTERRALVEIVKQNKAGESRSMITMEPSLCVDIKFLQVYKQQLREPRFAGFRTDVQWEECTWLKLINSARRST
ncbi:bifunctional non-homologous end joining protein LigD [Caldalkalibacillus uzonensis]|uniref:Bifunctional non-homologous end joining protein LigD n=1 Tax=Caldalkalibacillus uzonensis TaxID=353224 RepID=A0ABU0CMB6_9BACI|nr:non-homologous end-joining DNA ligase [Caldalkalibacillus uzonensis]MDQ0337566.1 bifunctional non-homologous end joining protein LigD [Caldalkalibacillus uzonensis]